MPRKSKLKEFKVTIRDEIVLTRTKTVHVMAKDKDDAEDIGRGMANGFVYPDCVLPDPDDAGVKPGELIDMDKDQTGNQPWEVEVEEAP